MCFDHRRAHDGQRTLRRATNLEREQALARSLKLCQRALLFTLGGSRSRLFSHVFQRFRIAGRARAVRGLAWWLWRIAI
jgi:hypothetical protein